MRIRALAMVAVAGLAVSIGGGQEGQAPVPLEVPAAWQLSIDVQTPRAIQVRLPGESKPTTFWYLLYTVTNDYRDPQTQRPTEQIFVPDFTLYTDTGQLLRAGKGVPNTVFEAIKKFHNNPHLKDMVAITGRILYGEDNAKDGVAVWPDFDPKAGSTSIFIGGLSGEIVTVKLPTPISVTRTDSEGKAVPEEVSALPLTKTLELDYEVPGEPAARLHIPLKLTAKKWIMR